MRVPELEVGLRVGHQPQECVEENGGLALYAPQAAHCNAQYRLLSALPVHLPARGLPGYAKHQQQDRGYVYRPQEEPQCTQRPVFGEPQAVHLWVFLGIV